MCITIPMRIVSVEGVSGCCEARGVRRKVRLDLLESQAVVGDYILIHAGYALQAMTEADAHATWKLFDEIISTLDQAAASTREPDCLMDLTGEATS
jgi:hydrogenase expression/formation protein HypC